MKVPKNSVLIPTDLISMEISSLNEKDKLINFRIRIPLDREKILSSDGVNIIDTIALFYLSKQTFDQNGFWDIDIPAVNNPTW